MFGLNKILFTHRNHKLNKQVQETQKQYPYLSVTYLQNDNHTDLRWQDGKLLSKRQRQQNKQKTKITTKNKQTNKTKQKQQQQQNGRRGRGLKNK